MGPLLFILYNSKMFELVENRLFVYADDSTLMVVVRKPADRPAVAASLNMELARFQEWCNHWCMILNLNKTKALVVCRSRTVSPPHGDLILSGVSIRASPNLDFFGVKFDSKLTFEDHVRGILSRVSQRIDILRLVKRIFVDTSVLLCCDFAFVLPILEYCSPVWGSAAECHLQLLERLHGVFGGQALSRSEFILSLCHRRRVAGLSMLYKVNSKSNHCLFRELPSASRRVRQTGVAAEVHPLGFEVSRCRTSQFAWSVVPAQVRMWNNHPYTVSLDGFKGEVNHWLLPWVGFSFFEAQVFVGLRKQFIFNFVFPTWACAAGFHNSNKSAGAGKCWS